MNKIKIISIFVLFVVLSAGILTFALPRRPVVIDKYQEIGMQAKIYPDYTSVVCPPNIAPLNFMIQEKGSYYLAKISCDKGAPIEISGKSPSIQIPVKQWHDLLDKNRNGVLRFDIFVKNDAGWLKFTSITNKIANENIDDYVVYRRLHPTHTQTRGRVGIFQRNLKNFNETPIIDNLGSDISCVNCHSFVANKPDKALIGVRFSSQSPKTLFMENGKTSKLDVKMGYTSWHPSGKLAAFSIDFLPPMFFHAARDEVRDTFDTNSAIACFMVDSKTVKIPPEISKKERMETWPAWSADGRYLYFCATPITWKYEEKKFPPKDYNNIKYDLVRARYDVEKDQWSESETVLSSKDTGLSISMPKVSPDNRWLVCCMDDFGYFPTWQQSADLYIVDLNSFEQAGRFIYHRLECNSNQSESWHSWSSNSRWLAFSTKGMSGVFTKTFISYIDENGKAYKPFVIPQKDPEYYNHCLEIFSYPELVKGPVKTFGERLAKIARGNSEMSMNIPLTGATPKTVTVPAANQVTHE